MITTSVRAVAAAAAAAAAAVATARRRRRRRRLLLPCLYLKREKNEVVEHVPIRSLWLFPVPIVAEMVQVVQVVLGEGEEYARDR